MNNTVPAKSGLVSVDILRAIAALGVFYYHLHIGYLIARYSGISWLGLTDNFGAKYAVPLFFLISGYCIHLSNLKYVKAGQALPLMDYYKRRILRIYPPYLIALFFSVGVNLITHDNPPVTTPDLLTHVFLLQGFSVAYFNSINVVLWTISIEMAFYILYPLFYYLRSKYSLNHALAFAFLVSGISIGYYYNRGDVSNPQRYSVLNLWFAWCCGAYLSDLKVLTPDLLKKSALKLSYIVIAIFFFLIKMFYQPRLIILNDQLNILIWSAPLVWLIQQEKWFAGRQSLVIRVLAAIGLSSYSLYLLHEPLIALKNYAAHQYLPAKLQLAGVFTGILLIPFITWISYLYIEKPFMVKKRKTPANA